jgi:hypothetical protein
MKDKLAARRHSYLVQGAQGKGDECFGVVGGEREIYASATVRGWKTQHRG